MLLWGIWGARGVQGDMGECGCVELGRLQQLDCSSGGAGGGNGGARELGREWGTGMLSRVLRGCGVAASETELFRGLLEVGVCCSV